MAWDLGRVLSGRLNRTQYVAVTVVVLYLLPILGGVLLRYWGLPVWTGFGSGGQTAISLMAFWYVQIPVFAWATLWRVQDMGWPRWSAAVLWLPIVNFVIWFWPGQASVNRGGPPVPPSGWGVRVLAWGTPLWILLAYAVALAGLVALESA